MTKSFRIIPQQALAAQAQSSDPLANVWVAANAGSGKTHVLTERVIRLLLAGTEPARILCLTYTRAAAAVMQRRIFDRLAQWTQLDDAALADVLQKLESKRASPAHVAAARTLFARALETPGGLKIQTIHAFCEALLHQFPLEANIAGHFDMMDDMQQTALLEEAKRHLLETVWRAPSTVLAEAFESVLEAVGEYGFTTLIQETITCRQKLKAALERFRHEGAALFYALFGLDGDETAERLLGELRAGALLDGHILENLGQHGGTNAAAFVAALEAVRNESEPEKIRAYCESAYFTAGNPRKAAPIFTKAVQAKLPDGIEQFLQAQKKLAGLLEKLKLLEVVRLNTAAYRLMTALLDDYEALKRARGLLDFDDLIDRALAMLKRDGAGRWVQYKLDNGIDHILVDEAQDTSPAQWEIVRLLSDEFFAGAGQRDGARTIFAVGDEKQSIYSFQGAVPEDFAANGRFVKNRAGEAQQLFRNVRLDFSFRSTGDVLSAVDEVFSKEENRQGLSADNEPTVHSAVRVHEPGMVDIWEALALETVEEPEDWRLPVDHLASPAVRLAGQIAETISGWLGSGEVLAGARRPMRASDIMVLVRKRGQFVHALSRALKNRGVAVAGADRLRLGDHIAVRDLMALGQFVLQPRDDLSLASVLKSPLFALEENDLLALAPARSGTLFAALEKAAREDTRLGAVVDELRHYRALADITPVFEFYSRVLSQNGGRCKILARLGSEAGDVLDAFLDYTLAMQKTGLPGLQAFLETLRLVNPEIKRELDQNREEVRIMTVHAAKGLEGRVVFLVDDGSAIWNARHAQKLLPVPSRDGVVPVWYPKKELQTKAGDAVIENLKQRAAEEYRRLLYVGMTRAEDRLVVCGYRGRNKVEDSWLPVVSGALLDKAQPLAQMVDGVQAWRYCLPRQGEMPIVQETGTPPVPPLPPLPDYLRRKAVAEQGLPQPLSPSGASVLIEVAPALDPAHMRCSPVLETDGPVASSFAIERGNLVHRLMQYLPALAVEERAARARTYLQHAAPHWSEEQRAEVLAGVFAVLGRPDLAPLFDTGSRAEAAVMGMVDMHGRRRPVSGQIARLAVLPDRVLIADFKTGRPPQSAADIPDAYLLQLALYQKLLGQIYPDHEIRTMLVYMQDATVFEPDRKKQQVLLEKLAQTVKPV
ncbi:MAG: Double-strand break repair helicase AddA [Candidatus Tokpelaia hoelldobleri]|uniref:DNA 3'-5' helicase n=1 Tax=Candidatus Tokpelaia hoelldobleri TaxID=1902579 RepID=A0A1U9JWL4_9HYPH|nr:MAG: Double-strand break repair helicase AddA [Candidatus Tokpelaia hoelldoblerii]